MNPLIVSAIAVAVVLLATLIFWLLRLRPVSPAAPPPVTLPSGPVPLQSAYPFEDEWEAHAPYPEYATYPGRTSAPVYRQSPGRRPDTGIHFPHYDSSVFDDVEPFEPEAASAHHVRSTTPRDTDGPRFSASLVTSQPPSRVSNAPVRCPHCGSAHIDTLNVARMAGGTLGSVAGATGGIAMALSGAEAGAAVGAIGGPIGAVFGGLTGALIAGLLGSAAGNVAGSAVGAAIDENMLDNYRCLSCGHTFGAQHG